MIIIESVTLREKQYTKTVSDSGMYIRKSGTDEVYSEAIDPVGSGRTYEETTDPIPVVEGDYTAELENLLLEEMGAV